MFKNCVFKVSVSTKKWWKAAGVRALKTGCQAVLAGAGTALVMQDVNWPYVLSSAALAAVLSIVTSVAGIPEVKEDEK